MKTKKTTPEQDAMFDERVARIFESLGMEKRTQVLLARALNIRQSSISDAKRRASVPSDWLLTLYMEHNVRPEFVLHGEMPMLKQQARYSDGDVASGIIGPRLNQAKRAIDECIEELVNARDTITTLAKA